jgi:capsular exopolysaccharide synthesis family protein
VLTSALPEEGKTATALNLAVVLAQLGRRVVLVDTDLRRPRLHRALGVENRRGVSTFLSGLEQDLGLLVTRTGVENLELIPSGPLPPNPSELLNSPVFSRMGHALLERGFDHVLFDSPPVLSVSDAVIVASVVDVGILVVRAARTPRQSVRLAAARLAQAAVAPLGVVLNYWCAETPGLYGSYQYYGRYESTPDAEPGRVDGPRQAAGNGA